MAELPSTLELPLHDVDDTSCSEARQRGRFGAPSERAGEGRTQSPRTDCPVRQVTSFPLLEKHPAGLVPRPGHMHESHSEHWLEVLHDIEESHELPTSEEAAAEVAEVLEEQSIHARRGGAEA